MFVPRVCCDGERKERKKKKWLDLEEKKKREKCGQVKDLSKC